MHKWWTYCENISGHKNFSSHEVSVKTKLCYNVSLSEMSASVRPSYSVRREWQLQTFCWLFSVYSTWDRLYLMAKPTGSLIQVRCSVESPGRDRNWGKPLCLIVRKARKIQWETCSKWSRYACVEQLRVCTSYAACMRSQAMVIQLAKSSHDVPSWGAVAYASDQPWVQVKHRQNP